MTIEQARKFAIIISVAVMLAVVSSTLAACTQGEAPVETEATPQSIVPENVNGITLGSSRDQVIERWGAAFKEEEFQDDAGYMSEAAYQWTYGQEASVLIGKDSGRVIALQVYSSAFQTKLGIKVGDNAEKAVNLYRAQFKEAVSRHDNLPLSGIFQVGNNMTLVLDTNKNDGQLVNAPITPDAIVQAIYLRYWDSID